MSEKNYVPFPARCCCTCAHYRPHYIFGYHGTPYPLRYGHCVILPFTICEMDDICDHFDPKNAPCSM